MPKGKLIIYYGIGQGKTTAALGRAIRAIGRNKKVTIFQFMKGRKTGEYNFLQTKKLNINLCGPKTFLIGKKGFSLHSQKAKECFIKVKKIVKEQKVQLLILDEILYALGFNLIKENDLINLIKDRKNINIILTGEKASNRLQKLADQITKFVKIKHYYDEGQKAIKGLDY